MERRQVESGTSWGAVVGYSRAVRVGSLVEVAGTTAALPGGGAVGGDDIADQARESLRRIVAALAEVGARPEDVVRTRMFVTDIDRWEEVGRAHGEVFAAIRPASSMVEVTRLISPELLARCPPGAPHHDIGSRMTVPAAPPPSQPESEVSSWPLRIWTAVCVLLAGGSSGFAWLLWNSAQGLEGEEVMLAMLTLPIAAIAAVGAVLSLSVAIMLAIAWALQDRRNRRLRQAAPPR